MPVDVTTRDSFFLPYGFTVFLATPHLIVISSSDCRLDVSMYDTALGFWVVNRDFNRPMFVFLLGTSSQHDCDVRSFDDVSSGVYLIAGILSEPLAADYVVGVTF
jgi:hypothetical protein